MCDNVIMIAGGVGRLKAQGGGEGRGGKGREGVSEDTPRIEKRSSYIDVNMRQGVVSQSVLGNCSEKRGTMRYGVCCGVTFTAILVPNSSMCKM